MSEVQYEKEVKPVKVLIDVEAGTRTNNLNEVFHLPHTVFKEWEELKKNLHIDLVKSQLGEETSVGFSVGQQHIVDFLQKQASQQMILTLASNFLYKCAIENAELIRKRRGTNNSLEDFLRNIFGE